MPYYCVSNCFCKPTRRIANKHRLFINFFKNYSWLVINDGIATNRVFWNNAWSFF